MPPSTSSSSDSSFARGFCAGAMAGLLSDGITYPISTAKSRLQVYKSCGEATPSTYSILAQMVKKEGWTKPFAGFGTLALAAPARALYFAGYEVSKKYGSILAGGDDHNPIVHFCAGPVAQLWGSILWVPMELVKERMQIQSAVASSGSHVHAHGFQPYKSSIDAYVRIYKEEGLTRGLFRGYVAHQLVWGPFNGIYFMIYDMTKNLWSKQLQKRQTQTQTQTQASDISLPAYAYPICGSIAGGISAFITSPLDLVKVRVQTQGKDIKYKNSLDCIIKVSKEEGFLTLYRGVSARVMWLAPNVAITMASYEMFMNFMKQVF